MISGAANRVRLFVASLSDFIIMKSHAIAGRDKPKDVYDLIFCPDRAPGGLASVAADWTRRRAEPLVAGAVRILDQKFSSVDHFGPTQLAVVHGDVDADEAARLARRAYELVRKLLGLLKPM